MTDTQFHIAAIVTVIGLSWMYGSLWIAIGFIAGWCIGWARRELNDGRLLTELRHFRKYLQEM